MAFNAIEKRKTTSGETRYKCRVRVKFNGKIIHNESKTFSKKPSIRKKESIGSVAAA
ncbi:hypothetical protein N483_11550 [Pseudoalteromonas luteoviolacea NCIMB 1944]|uniref:Uncharacterized protein n=1 Tax=Pseudoalteromonas luteoviolacea (strain 2ta16) TaxID=1353533 RepID=V4HLY2_PSEL2|nr:hypothetical protein PL2TA16_05296 [Pseudoalteromonas luteoviolacea 2ta16]KZN42153.1 hypothetical protein N483_11550 [Pseudoalteromonas luteoviolacea NCIMB 1944]